MKANRHYTAPFTESPTDAVLRTLPKGDGSWDGASIVYRRLADIANQMGVSSAHLSDLHIETMAVMGCGHEETMKAQLHKLDTYGWKWNETITNRTAA